MYGTNANAQCQAIVYLDGDLEVIVCRHSKLSRQHATKLAAWSLFCHHMCTTLAVDQQWSIQIDSNSGSCQILTGSPLCFLSIL